MEEEIKQEKPKKSIWKKWWLWLIIIVIIFSVFGYNQHQKSISNCKEKCIYSSDFSGNKLWYYIGDAVYGSLLQGNRSFSTQEQCIDYCLIQSK
jgi:hypothetical protein